MWTIENRCRYDRSHLRYESDLTDEEWAEIEPEIPPAKRGGNKRTVNNSRSRERRDVYPEHRLPMARYAQGSAAEKHGARLLRPLALRPHVGSHSSRALREMS